MLLEILADVIEPIIESDPMTSLLNSAFGDCLKNMIENLFKLVNKVGILMKLMLSQLARDNCCKLCQAVKPEYNSAELLHWSFWMQSAINLTV